MVSRVFEDHPKRNATNSWGGGLAVYGHGAAVDAWTPSHLGGGGEKWERQPLDLDERS
jgi:hypothetical protein